MKRRLLIIGMFLLLGAVVNVAVAWQRSMFSYGIANVTVSHDRITKDDLEVWAALISEDRFPEPTSVTEGGAVGIYNRQLTRTDHETPGWPVTVLHKVKTGLPLRSLAGEMWYEYGAQPFNPHGTRAIFLWEMSWSMVLPLRPIWYGFAINTMFYAAILWLLIPGPFAVRRFLRLRRGLCPKCGYDLRESKQADVCPECGCQRRQ